MGFQAIHGDRQLRWKACGSTMQEYNLFFCGFFFLSLCGYEKNREELPHGSFQNHTDSKKRLYSCMVLPQAFHLS